jgi:hypothetical protein
MKAHHGLSPRPPLIDPDDVDDNILRDRDNAAAVADEHPAFAVKRHPTIAARQNGAKAFAPKQRGCLKRYGPELGAAGAARECDSEAGDQCDDQHHRHDFNERKAAFPVNVPCPRQPSHAPMHLLMSQSP